MINCTSSRTNGSSSAPQSLCRVTREYSHFLNLSSLSFHSTAFHPTLGLWELWFLFLFPTLQFSEQFLLLPWVICPQFELLLLHGSAILIPSHFLDFRSTFPKGFSTCSRCSSPRTIHSLYSDHLINFPTKHSPLPVFLIPVVESPFMEGEGDRRVGRFLLSKQAQSTLNEPQSTYHSGLELLNSLLRSEAPSVTHVAPVLRDRRNSTRLEKRTNPLSQTQFMAHSSNSSNIPSSLILQQKLWILSTPSFIRLKGNPKPKLQLSPNQAIKLPRLPEQPF